MEKSTSFNQPGPGVAEQALIELPADAIGRQLLPCLHAASLRNLALCCRQLLRLLRAMPEQSARARDLICWCAVGAGASVDAKDVAVATGAGNWHPGGVALAQLQLTAVAHLCVRFQLETGYAKGDLILGLTQCVPTMSADELQEGLDQGYSFIMGRELGPPSIFYGGRSLRCCYSLGDDKGPRIDYGTSEGPQVGTCLARLRHVGDWVDFQVKEGVVFARDFAGGTFKWHAQISPGEIWQPALAWTGSDASVRVMLQPHAQITGEAKVNIMVT